MASLMVSLLCSTNFQNTLFGYGKHGGQFTRHDGCHADFGDGSSSLRWLRLA